MIAINYPLSATFVPDRQKGQEEKTGTFALTMGSFTIYSQEKVIMIGSTEQTAAWCMQNLILDFLRNTSYCYCPEIPKP